MTDSTDDYRFGQSYDLAPLVDDCTLLGSLLDDCLRNEVGEEVSFSSRSDAVCCSPLDFVASALMVRFNRGG